MTSGPTRCAIALMVIATFVMAGQDAISRHLASEYNVLMIVMIRYCFFAGFVLTLSARYRGGLMQVARSAYPALQMFRGALLAGEVCVMVLAFTYLGLVEAHAIFACAPLVVAALSGPVLGETVGWRRWGAIGVGFVGVFIILQPGRGVFAPAALLALVAALMFALYALLTRFVARKDSPATSFFWTGIAGAIAISCIGIWAWQPLRGPDWGWMALLCLSSVLGHWVLIKCYDMAEASALQPFAYLHLVFASILGVVIFGEILQGNVLIGVCIVVAAGLFTLLRTPTANG